MWFNLHMKNETPPGLQNWTFVLLSLAMVLLAGYFSYWTDSEMWPATATKYMFSDRFEYYFGTKPLFHFILFLSQNMAQKLGIHPMDLARGLMIVNTIFLVAVVFLLLRRLAGNAYALTGIAILLSLSTFVKRSGQVRSDIVAANILLWALWLTPKLKPKWRIPVFVGFAVLALLITPKAIFWLLALWPFLPKFSWQNIPRKKIGWGLAAMGAVGLGICLWPAFRNFLNNPLTFFFNSFATEEVGYSYFDPVRFQHVMHFLFENIYFLILLIVFNLLSWRRTTPFQRVGLTLALLLLFYPDRLPFMIAALIPFFVLNLFSSPIVIRKIQGHPALQTGIIGLCFLLTLHWTLSVVVSHSNNVQRDIAFWLQDAVEKLNIPSVEIYDPVGILPRQNAHYWFLGPGQTEMNQYVLTYIEQHKPELILFTSKVFFLADALIPAIGDHYHNDGSGVFVRSWTLPAPKKRVKTEVIRSALKTEFPRLAGKEDITWEVRLLTANGAEIKRNLKWTTLESNASLSFPPGINSLQVQPFDIALPFNRSLPSEFSFDVQF